MLKKPRTSLGYAIQKLPPRTEAGREAAKALAARPGTVMQMVDYSELELRTLAALGITAEDFLRT